MTKSSTKTAPKNPTPLPAKSAWARGPPQTATAPSPRSQSPAPSTPIHQIHSRRPSTLVQGIPIKDGVSVPRRNVGVVKQGSAVTFGSIDDVSAPISSSPAAAPALKSEGVKSFGSVPAAATPAGQNGPSGHVNGKASISSRASVVPPTASSSTSTTPLVGTTAATSTPAKPVIDIKKLFKMPTSAQPSQMDPLPGPPPMPPSQMPPKIDQHMPKAWQGYYPYPPPDQQQHYMYSQWYPTPMPMQAPHASNSIGGLTSPPPTPSSTSIPRLNAGPKTFVSRRKVTLKKEDGTEVNLDNTAKSSPVPAAPATAPPGSVYKQGSPGTPNRRPASIRIESEDQRKARLADEEAKEKERQRVKAAAEEKIRKEKEEAERKVREAVEKKRAEEEAEKERIRKEEEAKAEAERAKLEAKRLRKKANKAAKEILGKTLSSQLAVFDGLTSSPPTPTSKLTPLNLSRHTYATVSASKNLLNTTASLPDPRLGLSEEERRTRAKEDGKDDDVAESATGASLRLARVPAHAVRAVPTPASVFEPPVSFSLEDFCWRYEVNATDRKRLARLEFQPGDEIETLPEDDWKGFAGFTTLAWRRIIAKNKTFISDSQEGLLV